MVTQVVVPQAQFSAAIADVLRLTREGIAEEAKRQHAAVMSADPRPLNFVRHVDGNEGASEESVKQDGIIVYDYNRLDLIAKDGLRILRETSPVGSGRDPHPGLYRDSHKLFINGHEVADLSSWTAGQEVSISNTVPYSRIIEIGHASARARVAAAKEQGKRVSIQNHIYEKAAQKLRRAYADVAFIEFTYRAVFGAGQVNQATQGKTALKRGAKGRFVNRGGTRAHNKAEVRWPTIVIHPNSARPGRLN